MATNDPTMPITAPSSTTMTIVKTLAGVQYRLPKAARCSAVEVAHPEVREQDDADRDDRAEQALDEPLEHERDPDEPVRRADELHHPDLSSSARRSPCGSR